MRRPHLPLSRGQEHLFAGGARGLHLENRGRPDFLLPPARHLQRRRGLHDRARFLQAGFPRAAHGIRRGSAEVAGSQSRRKRRIMALLEIKDLHATVGDREILKGIDLTINAGEVHAIMGPNGSGKSTLAQVLAGRELYVVTGGQVTYDGKDLLALSPEDRAREGIFLAFQYPVEIPGASNMYFLKAALNTIRKHRNLPELDAMDFLDLIREKMTTMNMDQTLLNRPVNTGFSGGEKKRNEIFQMAVLEPRLAILDETDSGLDIDALKLGAAGVNAMRSAERAMVVVTHYQPLLSEIVPDYVHVLADGRIVKSGGKELALELEAGGYAALGIQDEAEVVGKR